jgi:glutamine amidotransferase
MIVIVDFGMGNLGSIRNMFHRIGAESVISGDAAIIARADKLVLPGVGSFDVGIGNLRERGLIPLLETKVRQSRTPVLGICLGMQLMTRRSEEGSLPGLQWMEAETVRFRFGEEQSSLKIPHMGWNSIGVRRNHYVLDGLDDEKRFYFVHSYHVVCETSEDVVATTSYGYEFTSVFAKGNIVGVQFHPEKSHKFGMALLKNFAGAER